jgi:hypothetical protein
VVAIKNVRDKQFQYLSQQVYPEDSGSLYVAYLDATIRPHGYLLLHLTQDTNDGLRFRTAIFPSEHPLVVYSDIVDGDEACEIELSSPPVLKTVHPKLRKAIISNCDKELVNCISECVLNVMNGNLSCNTRKLRKHKVALSSTIRGRQHRPMHADIHHQPSDKPFHHEFHDAHYVPVEQRRFQDIRIELLTSDGLHIPLEDGITPTRVVLHFRKNYQW